MKKIVAILMLLLASQSVLSQEVRLGLTIGTAPLKRVHFDTAFYLPQNSYSAYGEKVNGKGVINDWKAFNSVNIGAVLNFSYRRFSFNMEPQYFFERSVYRFEEPLEVKRVVGAKGFRMPFYFTYKFFKKENSSYFLLGWNVTKVKHVDFQHPKEGYYFSNDPIYQGDPDFGDNHFEGALYDGTSTGSFIIGFGKQFKKLNSSLRWQVPTRRAATKIPAQIWTLEWTFSWLFLSTKEFTNKHPLYIE